MEENLYIYIYLQPQFWGIKNKIFIPNFQENNVAMIKASIILHYACNFYLILVWNMIWIFCVLDQGSTVIRHYRSVRFVYRTVSCAETGCGEQKRSTAGRLQISGCVCAVQCVTEVSAGVPRAGWMLLYMTSLHTRRDYPQCHNFSTSPFCAKPNTLKRICAWPTTE